MKGLFIPDITAEMFKNGCLESIEALMTEGEIYDIDYSPWIPVSERLPEDAQKILYSTKTGQVYSGVYLDDESENQWYSILNDCNEYNDLVTAWLPFPKPYTTESEAEK